MKPYYEESGITIYHGDCRDILPRLNSGYVLLTDPPYGINLGSANNTVRTSGYGGHLGKGKYLTDDDSYENFTGIIAPVLMDAIRGSSRAVVFTGPHIHEQMKPDAIGGIYHPSATGRTAWGSKNLLPILFYGVPPKAGRHRPTVLRSTASSEPNGHPCPKPIGWVKWLLSLATESGDMILDPFMGSGTTLVAAKDFGLSAIGIEREERYCEIAVNRLRQNVLDLS